LGAPADARRADAMHGTTDQSGPPGHECVLRGAVFLGGSIVLLPAAVSRSLSAVASHAIGFAEPRHRARSPGSGACRGRWGGPGSPVRWQQLTRAGRHLRLLV